MIENRQETIHVLLVDNSLSIRKMLKNILNPQDRIHVVAEAGDAQTALDIIEHGFEGIVVLDINLLEIDGIRLARRIKRRRPDLPIIFISFQSDIRYLQESFKAGASAFVLKERAYEDLPQAIESASDGINFISIDLVP